MWLCQGLCSQAACEGLGPGVNVSLAPLVTAKTLLRAGDVLRETAQVSFATKVKGQEKHGSCQSLSWSGQGGVGDTPSRHLPLSAPASCSFLL